MEQPDFPTLELIISGVSLLISLIALLISVIFTKTAKKRSSVEMSITLASEYQKMLDDMWVIKGIIEQHTDVFEAIEKITPEADFDFNYDELKRLLSKKEIELLEGFFEKGQGLQVETIGEFYECEASVLHSGTNSSKPTDNTLRHFFKRKFISALNKAEYISMGFAHEIAIDGVVYQSLHQSFFQYVKMFYFHIAYMNQKSTDHYYTNLITLYRSWKREDDHRSNDLKTLTRVKDINQRNTEKPIKPNIHHKRFFTLLS